MKKLLLLAAFGLMTSPAFAQSADVNQTGNDNDGTIDQVNGVNNATITQDATTVNGNGNFATVDQDGGHTAVVIQTGNSDAEVDQFGGTGNDANITQTGTFDRTYNTYGQTIRNYFGKVTQDGSSNEADIIQVGSSGRVQITQTGDGNEAIHDQGTAAYAKNYISGTIVQDGDDHNAYQYKQSTGGVTTMNITQNGGDNNTATQDISVLAGGEFRNGHTVDATQTGNDNVASQDLSDNYSPWSLSYADLDITQVGDENEAFQTSHFSNVRSAIGQTGFSNLADIEFGERGQDLNNRIVANATQFGDNNDAFITMDARVSAQVFQGSSAGVSHGNEARITATDDVDPLDDTNAIVEQYGAGDNYANVNLTEGADLDVLQDGEGNELFGLGGAGTAAQVLNGGNLTVDQVGSFNDAFVNMTSGGTGTIDQNGLSNNAQIVQN